MEGSGADLVDLARRFDGIGLAALSSPRSGATGPSRARRSGSWPRCSGAGSVPLVASGGVGSLDDLRALARLRSGDRALAGVIVGRAIYEGRFGVADALASLSEAVTD